MRKKLLAIDVRNTETPDILNPYRGLSSNGPQDRRLKQAGPSKRSKLRDNSDKDKPRPCTAVAGK